MDWLSTVGQLRRDLVAVLADLSSLLGTTRGQLVTVTQHSTALIVLQDQAAAGVDQIPRLTGDLADALHHWTARMETSSTRQQLRETRAALGELARIRVFFQFLSTITSIQVARDQSDQLTAFVQDLRAMPPRIEAELVQVQGSLDDFDRSFEGILNVARSGADDLSAAAARLTAILAPVAEAERQVDDSRRKTTAQAHQLSGRTQAAIGQLVRAFQFSDSAAQRMEHVEAILAEGQGRPAHGLLAAAQILALGEDATDILQVLDDSFRTIEGLGGAFLTDLAAQRDGTARLLALQDKALLQLHGILDAIAPALRQIIARSEGFEVQIAAIRGRLGTLEAIGQTIGLAAVNAYVKAARAETGQQELTYIAMSVKENAGLALRVLKDTATGLDLLHQSLEAQEYVRMRQGMTELDAGLGALDVGLAQARDRQAALAGLEDEIRARTTDLAGLAGEGRTRVMDLGRVIASILDLGRSIRSDLPASADLDALTHLQALYTMAREREVHSALTGEVAVEDAAQDDLDSILF